MEEFLEKIELLQSSVEKYKNNKDKLLSLKLSNVQIDDMNIIINKLQTINDKITDITSDIDELQYDIDNNELNKSDEINNRIRQHKIDKHMYDTFAPYMLAYNIILNNFDN